MCGARADGCVGGENRAFMRVLIFDGESFRDPTQCAVKGEESRGEKTHQKYDPQYVKKTKVT